MSETIKDNIIFGEPYDHARYRSVIRACGLETDLTLFEHGDQTEIGEKGITLSGGQKARITLARAVYSETAIVLLDGKSQRCTLLMTDIFSALDALTSRFIIDNLFVGELMRGRTVLLIVSLRPQGTS
jgi:ABC-type multidrug transport system fused ATPase/permease subunit